MAAPNTLSYKLVQDEPWMFLDARKNPVHGHKLTFQLSDGTYIEMDLTETDYHNPATVKARLQVEIEAHAALTAL
jgi:hypothetical protein